MAETREDLITAAKESVGDSFPYEVPTGPGKFEGSSDPELAYALHNLAGISAQDDEAGSVVETGLWAGRFGRFILTENSQGFVDVTSYDTPAQAERAMTKVEHFDWS